MTNWALGGGIGKVVKINEVSPLCTSQHTKGSWLDISASGEEYDCHGFIVSSYSMTHAAEFLVDIGLGSTPDILINNLQTSRLNIRESRPIVLPIFIPKNTQIQARMQSSYSGTNGFTCCWYGIQGNKWGANRSFTKCYTYGANTGDSGGTWIDPGTSAGTFGSYVQFISALPETIKGFMFSVGMRGDTSRASTHWHIDVAKNYGGSEETLIDQWVLGCSSNLDIPTPQWSPFFPIQVEKGESIAVRAKCSLTTTDRYIDVTLYCFA